MGAVDVEIGAREVGVHQGRAEPDHRLEQLLDEDVLALEELRRLFFSVVEHLKEQAERAKHELSSATTTDLNLPFIAATDDGPKHLTGQIDRETLEALQELGAELVFVSALAKVIPVRDSSSGGSWTA